jgi:nicotinate-nucleotide adenylyltransferase
MRKRRLGVMGGTFDPIHNGHLVAASEVASLFDLDEVVFVPSGQPWQKKRQVSAGEDRYLMTVIATAANPRFSVSRVDIDRGGLTYTKDTLRDLQALNPDSDLYFITGADALAAILSWHDLDQLFAVARFVGVSRPGYELAREHLAEVLAGYFVDRLPSARRRGPPVVVPDARRRRAIHLQARALSQTRGRRVTADPEAIEMATVAARAAASKLADDVVVIDVSGQLVITDCFVIASASNERQVNAIVDEVEEKMRRAGYKPARREGTREGRWTLLDYVDIVVHIQHQDERNFYALDRLWGDCPVVPVDLSADSASRS